MSLPHVTTQRLLTEDASAAWATIRSELQSQFFAPLAQGNVVEELIRREKAIEPLELLLGGAAWTLWEEFATAVPRGSARLLEWWHAGHGGKAVLILDGLSAREMPVLMAEAAKRGFFVNLPELCGSELPAETNAYARALGFSHRGALDNNGAGGAHKVTGAYTLTNQLPWADLARSLSHESRLFVWHEWPDVRVHDLAGHGKGIRELLPEVVQQLRSDDFWTLVAKLATGREVLITSDHGYADAGSFRDAETDEKNYLRDNFGANRYRQSELTTREWLPPLALTLDCPSGRWSLALGRTKWAVAGGNKTLSHGGLTLLETFVPFLTLSKI
ncbi:MAG TPA: hypothetical protein VFT72_06110 [Opitutaceae bacterium]|nr:hypothetical protein [Opitutaceae bacterium]